jgi:hypothetical protein
MDIQLAFRAFREREIYTFDLVDEGKLFPKQSSTFNIEIIRKLKNLFSDILAARIFARNGKDFSFHFPVNRFSFSLFASFVNSILNHAQMLSLQMIRVNTTLDNQRFNQQSNQQQQQHIWIT